MPWLEFSPDLESLSLVDVIIWYRPCSSLNKACLLISSMRDEVLELDEALFAGTVNFKELVVRINEVFPCYVTDFSL